MPISRARTTSSVCADPPPREAAAARSRRFRSPAARETRLENATRSPGAPGVAGVGCTARTAGSASGSPRRTAATSAGAGGEVGDVVLAEVDEREAQRQRVGPAGGAGARPVSASEIAAVTEVAKCSEGIAAQGLPPSAPYIAGQADFQVSSPTSTMIRRTSSPVWPCSEAHQGGAVGRGEVDGAADVEDGGEPAGGAREAIGVAERG